MNFPDNQLTGLLAELNLEQIFSSWRWVVGRDRIDVGYDLTVVPNISRYKGARFLVQSKGTAKTKKNSIVATVSKERLRQYAENPHPVFIIRVLPDGSAHWIHAQEWAKLNSHKLSGDGYSGIKFDAELSLGNKDTFISYLDKVMRPIHETMGALKSISDQRSRYLSAIDPRFIVKANVIDGKETYEVLAASGKEHVAGRFSLKPSSTPENIGKLKEAIDFGVPASVDVDEFIMESSPLFEELGLCRPLKGNVLINSKGESPGYTYLYPGSKHSITAAEFAVPSKIFTGRIGAVIENQAPDSIFTLKLRLEPGALHANFAINRQNLSRRSARSWNELVNVADWAEQVFLKKSLRIEIEFRGRRINMPALQNISNVEHVLWFLIRLGKLHALAKYFEAEVFLPENFEFTEDEDNDITMAYNILRGESCLLQEMKIEFETSESISADDVHDFGVETNLSVCVAGQKLGAIPVKFDLHGYKLEKNETTNMYTTLAGNEGEATISFLEGKEPSGLIERT